MKHLWRLAIIVFCLWHMFAVAIYVIPDEVTHPVPKKVVEIFIPYVRPYLYATSQWQKWNIFSPNPLRRVSSYTVQIEEDGQWSKLFHIEPKRLPWWKKSRELKALRRMEDVGEDGAHAYIRFLCRGHEVPHGAHVRVERQYYVIPTIGEIRKIGGWRNYWPDKTIDILGDAYCTTP